MRASFNPSKQDKKRKTELLVDSQRNHCQFKDKRNPLTCCPPSGHCLTLTSQTSGLKLPSAQLHEVLKNKRWGGNYKIFWKSSPCGIFLFRLHWLFHLCRHSTFWTDKKTTGMIFPFSLISTFYFSHRKMLGFHNFSFKKESTHKRSILKLWSLGWLLFNPL